MNVKSAIKIIIDLCKDYERIENDNHKLRQENCEMSILANNQIDDLKSKLYAVDKAIFPNGIPENVDSARPARIAALVKSAIFVTKLKKAGVEEIQKHIVKKEPVKRVFRNETLEMLIRRDPNEQRKFQRLVVQKPHGTAMRLLRRHATFGKVGFNDSQVKRLRAEFGCD